LCTPKTGKDYGYFVSHSNETTGRATLASFLLANQLCHSDSIAQKRRWVDWDWRDMSIYDPASKTTEKEVAAQQGANLREMKNNVLGESFILLQKCLPSLSSVNMIEYSRVFGLIDQNAAVVEAFPSTAQRKKLRQGGKVGLEDIPHSVGSALFLYQSCINHNCNPNTMVRGGLLSSPNAKIELVATKEIEEGEELFISYIDETLAKRDRQKSLLCAYNFRCQCSKCSQK